MDNWTSRPQDQWPRLTALANRDRSSVEEAQMATYESPYTAENPASFYHYSLHPDDLATRRSISVYSLKDPDRKKNGSRFPQFRVCFATMLLVSLGVAIAVAVTLAIMLSDPQPKFYRNKSTDNTTLSKDFLKEREVNFGNDICELMNALFDLRDSSHQSREVTDCSVFLADSPGKMVINVKLNVDETFIKSDSNKVKAMLVANAFVLSSNSSVKKQLVPSNTSHTSTMTSDGLTPSTTSTPGLLLKSNYVGSASSSETSMTPDILAPSATVSPWLSQSNSVVSASSSKTSMTSDVFTPSATVSPWLSQSNSVEAASSSETSFSETSSSSKIISPSSSNGNLASEIVSVGRGDISTISSTSIRDVSSSPFVPLRVVDKATVSTISDSESRRISVGDVTPSVSLSTAVHVSPDVASSYQTNELTSARDNLSSDISNPVSKMSTDRAEPVRPMAASVISSQSVSNPVSVSYLESSEPYIATTATTHQGSGVTMTSLPEYTTKYNGQVLSSMMSSVDGSHKEEVTSFAQVSSSAVSLHTSDMSTEQLDDSPSSITTSQVGYLAHGEIVNTSVEPGLEATVMATAASHTSQVISASILISSNDLLQSSVSGASLSSAVSSFIVHSMSTQHVSPSYEASVSNVTSHSTTHLSESVSTQHLSPFYVASSSVSNVTPQSTAYPSESGVPISNTISHDSAIQAELSTPVLYPSVVVDTAVVTSLESDMSSQSMTVSATVTVPALMWLDTTMLKARIAIDNNSSSMVEIPTQNNDINRTLDKPSFNATVPELGKNLTLETSPSMVDIPMQNNDINRTLDNPSFNVTVPELRNNLTLETSPSMVEIPMQNNDINRTLDNPSFNVTVPELRNNLTLETSPSMVEIPMQNNDINRTLEKPSFNATVPELKTNLTLGTSPLQAAVPELANSTDSMNNDTQRVTVPLLHSEEVRVPVVSTTQNPTSTVLDVGRAIFESEISNRAMGTANPQDFWDNILKMVQYTSTKKPEFPNMEVLTPRQNLSSDSNAFSSVNEAITSSYEPVTSSSLLVTGTAELRTDTVLASSTLNSTAFLKPVLNDGTVSSVNPMKPSDNILQDSISSTLVLSSGVPASSTPPSLIRATPVLTAEPGFMSSVEHSAITDRPIMDNSTSTADANKSGDMRLSTTLDASVISLSSSQISMPSQAMYKTVSGDVSALMTKTVTASPAVPSASSTVSDIVPSSSSSMVALSDDYAFYDLMPLSLVSPSSSPGSTGVLSDSIVSPSDISPTSSLFQQQRTDEMDFYDLIPASNIASDEISSSKVESATIKTDPISTSTTVPTGKAISSLITETLSAPTVYPIPSINMELSSTHLVDAGPTISTDASATSTVDARPYVSIDASVTSTIDASPSASMDASATSTIDASSSVSMDASVTSTVDASSSVSMDASVTSTIDASPSASMDASATSTIDASSSVSMDASVTSTVDASSSVSMDASVTSTVDASPSVSMDASVTSTVDASSSVSMDASATSTIDARPSVSMDASVTSAIDARPSVSMDASATATVDASPSVSMDASATPTIDASPSVSMDASATSAIDASPSVSIDASATPTIDASPSVSMDASITSAIDARSSVSMDASATSTIDASPSVSMDASATSTIVASPSVSMDASATATVDASQSFSDVIASTTTGQPPSDPVVFDPGFEFGNKLFFANDFVNMDFTRTNTADDDKSISSSLLLNTVPIIPKVTTPSLFGSRVRVPNLFQGETNPFQTVPATPATTPKPEVTTPQVAPPTRKVQGATSSSSGQFLFDLGSLGSSFGGGGLGLGNINFQ